MSGIIRAWKRAWAPWASATLVALALACVACGGGGDGAGDDGGADAGEDGGSDDGGDDAGMDAGGDDGGGGADAGGDDDGGGSDAGGDDGGSSPDGGGAECPEVAPTDGDSCSDTGLSCTYMSCDDYGVARGVCSEGAWDVETEACSELPCESMTCSPGELCKRQIGGALLASCEDNPCGTGPIVRDCACELCGGFECTLSDLQVDCNTCPSGTCP